MASSKPTLTYFAIPGKGEVARLAFTLGKVDFVDKRIQFSEWPTLKPTTPFGQLPLLEVDGTTFAQSAAIDHYAGKLSGLVPEDPAQALLSDQAYFFVGQDVWPVISPTMAIKDPEEQFKARRELAKGPLAERLATLDKLVASRPGKWLGGDRISLGDLQVFNFLGMLRGGFWRGIPTDILEGHPALVAFRNDTASLPEVASFYAAPGNQDDVRTAGYTPDSN